MRYLTIFSAVMFVVGIFFVGQAAGGGQQGSQSQYGSSGSGMNDQQQSRQKMGSPESQQQKMAAGQLKQEQVRQLQKSLNDRGFQAGPVDGIMGPRTKGALRNFQQFEGMTASGEPNQQTLEALDIETGDEFIGISPEFGEDQQRDQQQKQDQQKDQQQDLLQDQKQDPWDQPQEQER